MSQSNTFAAPPGPRPVYNNPNDDPRCLAIDHARSLLKGMSDMVAKIEELLHDDDVGVDEADYDIGGLRDSIADVGNSLPEVG